jgi:ATP-dependent Clp protease ATP-binding subunit ClpA
MSTTTTIGPEAAIALGIASTAMPFARTPEEEAERWLRVLRLNGDAGAALQALGVSEGQLQAPEESDDRERVGAERPDLHDAVSQVTEHAIQIARERDATEVATTDVLMAVMRVYGADFDRVLRAHGANRDDLIEQLGAGALERADL